MIAAFDIAALRCACGSPAVMCVDPGSDAEMDPVFVRWVVTPAVAPRAWCMECFAAFATLIPHEAAPAAISLTQSTRVQMVEKNRSPSCSV